jgi:uncharacterized membrane protein
MPYQQQFISKEEGERIIQSIKYAENMTSGEIRVHFHRKIKGDIMEEAIHFFRKLKMDETEAKNGVLIFIAPENRKFSIIGDSGIDAVVPENFWEDIKNKLSQRFQANEMAEGLVECIETIGEKLKTHFPIQSDDKNELPDTISFG